MHTAVETISPALILLDAQGNVVFANDRAQEHLAENDSRLRVVTGRLVANGKQQITLEAFLQGVPSEETMIGISNQSEKPKLWLIRVPVSLKENTPPDARRPAIALMVIDSAAINAVDLKRFAKIYGLSPSEARIAQCYSNGNSHKEIALELDLAPATVRNYLQRIYCKLNIGGKAELASLLARCQ